MLLSKIKTIYENNTGERICQGDILRDIKFSFIGSEGLETLIELKYAVVMNQDCDLSSDFESRIVANDKEKDNDKYLPTILVCPAYPSGEFFNGDHIGDWKMRIFNVGDQKKLKSNNEYNRYHFLLGRKDLSVPELVIDFKHFYTIPFDILQSLYKEAYITTINELFRERLSQRFSNYLSRFGLPKLSEISENQSE